MDLDPAAAWLAAHGLPSRWAPPGRPLSEKRWGDLRSASLDHRLDGLLVRAVATEALPTTIEQKAEVARIEIDLTRRQMRSEAFLVRATDTLDAVAIEYRVVKGLALAVLDYPDALMRPTTDVDLVVRGGQIDQAVETLVASGGRIFNPDPVPGTAATVSKGVTVVMDDEFEVDLHRLLVWGPIGVRLPPDELWKTSRAFDIGGRSYSTMGVEATLIHVCLHLVIGGYHRALSLRDVAQLLMHPSLDPDLALRVARRWGALAALADGVAITACELDLVPEVPLTTWAADYRPSQRDRLWLRIDRSGDPLGPLQSFAVLIEQRTMAERARYLRASFFPAPGTAPSPVARVRRVLRRNLVRWRRRLHF